MENILENKIKLLSVNLDHRQMDQFHIFYELLVEWNKVMNLTAITDYKEVVDKHFIDSLCIEKITDMGQVRTVIDVGTGAGFPGIPLKIAYPHLKITLLDSLNKRIKFLNEVIAKLELKDIEAIHGRAEDIARKEEYREQYDMCVSRAVANLSTLTEYSLPFVKTGGIFISYKAEKAEEEIEKSKKAVTVLGGKTDKIVKYQLPETEIGRTLIKIKKVKKTEKKYPRKAGMPSKEPL